MRGLLRYLFPPVKLVDRLPLLPREFVTDENDTPPAPDAHYLLGRTAARTNANARRLLAKNTKKSVRRIANEKRRERRRKSRWARAWRKLIELL